jgi:hypothetical protein
MLKLMGINLVKNHMSYRILFSLQQITHIAKHETSNHCLIEPSPWFSPCRLGDECGTSLQPSTSGSKSVQGSGIPQGATNTGLDSNSCF